MCLQLVCREEWWQILDLDITEIASPSAPSRNFVIDLSADRIKQKDKRHVEVDESKEVKGPAWQNADCTDAKAWQSLELDAALKNATPLLKMYKLSARGLICISALLPSRMY